MTEWPLAMKIRVAAVGAAIVVVVVAVWLLRPSDAPAEFPVAVTTEEWRAGQPAGGWVPVMAPAAVAVLAEPVDQLTGRVAAYPVPAGSVVSPAMLRPEGSAAQQHDVAPVWVLADTARWHGELVSGQRAVFARTPAGCAEMELVLLEVSGNQVAVEAGPELFATLVVGEPWHIWAAPSGGWADRCAGFVEVEG